LHRFNKQMIVLQIKKSKEKMKKIAFMFACAAMVAACGNEVKTATDAQKDSLMNVVIDSIKATVEAPVAPEALAEDADEAAKAAYDSCTKVYEAAKAAYDEQIAAIDTANEAVKAAFEAKLAAFEAELNAPVAEEAAAEGEEKTEE